MEGHSSNTNGYDNLRVFDTPNETSTLHPSSLDSVKVSRPAHEVDGTRTLFLSLSWIISDVDWVSPVPYIRPSPVNPQ